MVPSTVPRKFVTSWAADPSLLASLLVGGVLSGLTRSLALVALAAAFTSCVDDNGSIVIIQNQIPTAGMDGCIIPGSPTLLRGQGTLDVALDQNYPYIMYPLVQNRLPPLAGSAGGGTVEPNRVSISSVKVIVTPPPRPAITWDPSCPLIFDWPHSTFIDPSQSVAMSAQAIRPCLTEQIRSAFELNLYPTNEDQYVFFSVEVRARGTHGGSDILSDALHFPVRVCYGCLQPDFPAISQCGTTLPSEVAPGNPCNPGQDALVSCCEEMQTKKLICPVPPPPMP